MKCDSENKPLQQRWTKAGIAKCSAFLKELFRFIIWNVQTGKPELFTKWLRFVRQVQLLLLSPFFSATQRVKTPRTYSTIQHMFSLFHSFLHFKLYGTFRVEKHTKCTSSPLKSQLSAERLSLRSKLLLGQVVKKKYGPKV